MKNYSDIPNGGPYSSNSNLHPGDMLHHQQQLRVSPQPGRSHTPSDYAAPPGGSDLGGGGGRVPYDDRGGSPYQYYEDEGRDPGHYSDNYQDGSQILGGYPEDDPRGASYPGDNYGGDGGMYRDDGDYYDRAPPYEDPPGNQDYPPSSHPSYQYPDGVLHDDDYGQRLAS